MPFVYSTPRVPRWLGPLLALSTIGEAVPAFAQSAERPKEDPPRGEYETVVTATQKRSTVFASPRATSSVDRDELKSRPPRTTAEALNEEEGVFVQRTNWAGGSPILRGLTGQQVLLMVDGIRLNNTLTRTGPNGMLTLVDPAIVDSIDVVRGPSSVLYGSDAVGGVVHVRSRKPVPILGSDIELSAGLRGIFTSYDQSGQGTISASGKWGRYALDTVFSLRRFGDLTAGSDAPNQPMTGYREGNLYLGGGVDLGRGTLVAVYQGTRQYDSIRTDLSRSQELYQYPELSRDLAYLRYEGDADLRGRSVTITATASYHRQREGLHILRIWDDRIEQHSNGADVLGVYATAKSDLGRAGEIVMGLESSYEWVESLANVGKISTGPGGTLSPANEFARFPGASSASGVAFFAQDELDLERLFGGNPTRPGRLRALVGARVGGTFVSVGRDERLHQQLGLGQTDPRGIFESRIEANPAYAGNAHLRYEPMLGLALSGGFASAYRSPNLADFGRLGREARGYLLPSKDLSPEIALSGEFGVRFSRRKFEGSAFYAYTSIQDVMAAKKTTLAGMPCFLGEGGTCLADYVVRANQDRAEIHAVEATARVHVVGGLSVFANVSFAHGTLHNSPVDGALATAEPLYKVPPANGVAAVQYRQSKGPFNFAEFSLRWAAPQQRLGSADQEDVRICPLRDRCEGTPGFAVLSVRGGARLTRQFYVTGAVENLTNATYRYHGSGIDGPGIGASISLEANYN